LKSHTPKALLVVPLVVATSPLFQALNAIDVTAIGHGWSGAGGGQFNASSACDAGLPSDPNGYGVVSVQHGPDVGAGGVLVGAHVTASARGAPINVPKLTTPSRHAIAPNRVIPRLTGTSQPAYPPRLDRSTPFTTL
jgi:hypothetical protein